MQSHLPREKGKYFPKPEKTALHPRISIIDTFLYVFVREF
jgi:hypothetical protein